MPQNSDLTLVAERKPMRIVVVNSSQISENHVWLAKKVFLHLLLLTARTLAHGGKTAYNSFNKRRGEKVKQTFPSFSIQYHISLGYSFLACLTWYTNIAIEKRDELKVSGQEVKSELQESFFLDYCLV